MSRQVFQMRVDDKFNEIIDFLKQKCGYNLNLKIKQYLMKLYEVEMSKATLIQNANDINTIV